MLSQQVLKGWLAGLGAAVVLPDFDPRALLDEVPAPRRVLLVTPDEASALLLAAGWSLPLLIRTTSPAARNKAVVAGGRLLVTALDALHAPSLAALLTGELVDAARVLVGAASVEATHPRHRGRAAWVLRLLGEGVLRVASRPEPLGAAGHPPGAIRREPSELLALARAGGGVLLRAESADAVAGLPVRHHRVDRPFPRGWAAAEQALRASEPGVDALEGPSPSVVLVAPGRVVATDEDGLQEAFVASMGVLLVAPSAMGSRPCDAPPSEEEVRRALAGLERGEDGEGPWLLASGDANVDLLADLAAIDALVGLRPTFSRARVAEAQRFRSPFVDRVAAWRFVADRYAERLRGWSLAERTRLALGDQAPRDLGELGRALDLSPALLADVLLDLATADVIAVRVEAAGGTEDWFARPGPAFGADVTELAARIAALRATRAGSRLQLQPGGGCRRPGVPGTAGERCGRCDVCDPEGALLFRGSAGAGTGLSSAPGVPLPGRDGSSALQHLFAGLGGGEATPVVAGPDGEVLLRSVRGDAAAFAAALVEAGGPDALFVLCCFRHEGPGGRRDLPPVVAADVVRAQFELASMAGARSESGRAGALVVERVGTEAGLWKFARRGAARDWSLADSRRLAEATPLSALRQALRRVDATEALTGALRALEGAVGVALDSVDDLRPALLVAEAAAHCEGLDPDDLAEVRVLRAVLVGDRPEEIGGDSLLATLVLALTGSAEVLAEAAARAMALPPPPPIQRRLLLRLAAQAGWAPRTGRELRLLASTDPLLVDARLEALVDGLTSATIDDFVVLADLAPGGPRRARLLLSARRLRAIPRSLFVEALRAALPEGDAAVGDVLLAAAPPPSLISRMRSELDAHLPIDRLPGVSAQLARTVGPAASAIRALLDDRLRAVEAVALKWRGVLELAEGGRLGEAAERLAELPALGHVEGLDAASRQGLDQVAERALHRQQELASPLARALAGVGGPDVEDEAFAALEDGIAEGFGPALIALLVRQHRREPEDPARALWLARALALGSDWAEAERLYRLAANLAPEVATRLRVEWEGVSLAFDEGEGSRALRWVARLVEAPWHQALAAHAEALVESGVVPSARRAELAVVLESTRSSYYRKATRALRA